jgi:hypothetical protein
MRRAGWLLPVLLLACSEHGNEAAPADTTSDMGARLEAAAVVQGLVADPAATTLVGAWARDTDRACVVDGEGGVQRIGIVSDYGEGQGCSGSGEVSRQNERLRVTIGACRFAARFEGDRIEFPGELPPACDTLCRGRASLAGFAVERQSESASEAAMLRGRGGRKLCG